MKKIILFLFVFSIAYSCRKINSTPGPTDLVIKDTLNSWVKYLVKDSGTTPLEDVWFINQNTGFTISNYQLFKTSDGGKTWLASTANIHNNTNIQFLDSLHGFIQGDFIYTSTDGGITWAQKNNGFGIYLQFVTPEIGYYFNTGSLFRTSDGANTWASILKAVNYSIGQYPFYFLDSLTGFSTMNGNCYKTRDGGINWDTVSAVTMTEFNGFYKMQFLNTLNGFCGANNELLKTTNGGKTWTTCFRVQEYDSNFHTFIIPQFFDANNGYLMTSSGIYKTTNGGKDWTTSCRVGKKNIYGIHFLDMNTGWACTSDGFILALKQ
jgi:photosystem II stability/assembly factor-like uncharacterized protein